MNQEILKQAVDEACQTIKKGGIILYPTDTIWGIGCDATNSEAVKKIIALKKRADNKSFVTLVSSLDMLQQYVEELPEVATDLVTLTTTPLTIIYSNATGLAENVIAEDGSAAIRVPDNEFCKMLINKLHKPIVSTSANISGGPSAKNFAEISSQIKEGVDYIVPSELEGSSTGKASAIMSLGPHGEVKIIRQ